MKHEWKKQEKKIYLPGKSPEFIDVPEFNFFTLSGNGNPNSEDFSRKIQVLYALSYAVRMSYKWTSPPNGYYEYTVYPLEGVWDIADKSLYVEGVLDKDNLAYEIMIRQPSFLTDEIASKAIGLVKSKKPELDTDALEFRTMTDGSCVQMMHIGPYDTEPESFNKMETFAKDNTFRRLSKVHREIYISDPRKTSPEKMKTVLRFKVSE